MSTTTKPARRRSLSLLVAALAVNSLALATLAFELTRFTAFILMTLVLAAPALLALVGFEARGSARAFCVGAFFPSFWAMLLSTTRFANCQFLSVETSEIAVLYTMTDLRLMVELSWSFAVAIGLLCIACQWLVKRPDDPVPENERAPTPRRSAQFSLKALFVMMLAAASFFGGMVLQRRLDAEAQATSRKGRMGGMGGGFFNIEATGTQKSVVSPKGAR